MSNQRTDKEKIGEQQKQQDKTGQPDRNQSGLKDRNKIKEEKGKF